MNLNLIEKILRIWEIEKKMKIFHFSTSIFLKFFIWMEKKIEENGPNFAGSTASGSLSPQHHALNAMHNVCPSSQHSSAPQQVWITDSGATNHMTADLSNLSLSSSYPANDMVQTANGEGLLVQL